MFTGIIEGTGTIEKISRNPKSRSAIQMAINMGPHSKGLKAGQSVSINGVCLTATGISGRKCTFEMIDETVKKTALGDLAAGMPVNIERSLRANGRLEGHFVLGHIDGTATIKKITEMPGEVRIRFQVPKELARYIVKKGSIAADGISLTVTDVRGAMVSVSIIPHTINITNLKTKRAGDRLNIETDILGKYVLD